jgi:transcription factor C subunit 3
VEFSYHALDGDVLAVLNLAAHGRITMRTRGTPKKAFGLVEEGYKTRFMDKELLLFTVELRPSDHYVEGNPMLPYPPLPGCLPASTTDWNDTTRLPAWIDINGAVVQVIWDLALTAVMAVLAVRPSVSVKYVERWVRPSLEAWEIQMIMGWLVDARVAEWTGQPKTTIQLGEWWWLSTGEGNEVKP